MPPRRVPDSTYPYGAFQEALRSGAAAVLAHDGESDAALLGRAAGGLYDATLAGRSWLAGAGCTPLAQSRRLSPVG